MDLFVTEKGGSTAITALSNIHTFDMNTTDMIEKKHGNVTFKFYKVTHDDGGGTIFVPEHWSWSADDSCCGMRWFLSLEFPWENVLSNLMEGDGKHPIVKFIRENGLTVKEYVRLAIELSDDLRVDEH